MNNRFFKRGVLLCGFLLASCAIGFGQVPSETPPPPSAPPSVKIPEVKEMKLPNGLRVVMVRKSGLPLVSVRLLIKSGAKSEEGKNAGLADITASLLIKGTETRSASDIAEDIEFLGGSIGSYANWNFSEISISVMSNSLDKALPIMSGSVIKPSFPEKEIQLLKKQILDGLKVSLKRPGTLLSYVMSRYTFGRHNRRGTPKTVGRINRSSIVNFHRDNYRPDNSILIFTGDISEKTAIGFARSFFGNWRQPSENVVKINESESKGLVANNSVETDVKRILVIDLPDSGQAAIGYAKKLSDGRVVCNETKNCESSSFYYLATVLNSVLGGGYSARLNREIRLKRGLSYGAGSAFGWQTPRADFSVFTQTKNESAAQVAGLIKTEIEKLSKALVSDKEMKPRKAVVTGWFTRKLQTNNGLAEGLSGLYLYDLNPRELDSYMDKVNRVSADEIKAFAAKKLLGGDIIIVGDAKMFMEDLQKRFPNQKIEVIKAKDVDLNSITLRKGE